MASGWGHHGRKSRREAAEKRFDLFLRLAAASVGVKVFFCAHQMIHKCLSHRRRAKGREDKQAIIDFELTLLEQSSVAVCITKSEQATLFFFYFIMIIFCFRCK